MLSLHVSCAVHKPHEGGTRHKVPGANVFSIYLRHCPTFIPKYFSGRNILSTNFLVFFKKRNHRIRLGVVSNKKIPSGKISETKRSLHKTRFIINILECSICSSQKWLVLHKSITYNCFVLVLIQTGRITDTSSQRDYN